MKLKRKSARKNRLQRNGKIMTKRKKEEEDKGRQQELAEEEKIRKEEEEKERQRKLAEEEKIRRCKGNWLKIKANQIKPC